MNMHKAPLIAAGTIFTLVAIFQLWRIINGTLVLFGTTLVPIWVSIIAFTLATFMAIWMFASACCCDICRTNTNKDVKNRK